MIEASGEGAPVGYDGTDDVATVFEAVRLSARGIAPPRELCTAVAGALAGCTDYGLVATVEAASAHAPWRVLAMTSSDLVVTIALDEPVVGTPLAHGGESQVGVDVATHPKTSVRRLRMIEVAPESVSWLSDRTWRAKWDLRFADGHSFSMWEPDDPRSRHSFATMLSDLRRALAHPCA